MIVTYCLYKIKKYLCIKSLPLEVLFFFLQTIQFHDVIPIGPIQHNIMKSLQRSLGNTFVLVQLRLRQALNTNIPHRLSVLRRFQSQYTHLKNPAMNSNLQRPHCRAHLAFNSVSRAPEDT